MCVFGVNDDLDFDGPFLGLGIRDMRMTRSDYDDNPNLLSANAYIFVFDYVSIIFDIF
jgi:hypothetical protein